MNKNKITKLLKLMETLRDPIKGCPWDKMQTLESIIPHSIEEVYEVAEEISKKNYPRLKDELGDMLFQVVYMSQIMKEKNKFNFNDVVETVTKKMIHRHPHVFKNKKFKNINEQKEWWDKSKNKVNSGLLDRIPKSFPPVVKTKKIQKIVADVGFDYKSNIEALNKVIEEAKELKKEIINKNKNKIQEELGDLLFACLDVSRKLKYDPELILLKANNKFTKRWVKIEKFVKKDNKVLNNLNINDFNNYWLRAKK